MLLDRLTEPFPAKSIHWRVGARTKDKTKGIALAYLDARDVMNRLDMVCSPENWQARYPRDGYCEIGIKVDNEWVWKGNGAGETDIEGEKGRYSDALKRCAVVWGVGRYLYYLPKVWVPLKNGQYIITPPELPHWALPK